MYCGNAGSFRKRGKQEMNALEELNGCLSPLGVPIETGVFSEPAPNEYIVLTPISDNFELHADDMPLYEVQKVRISIFSKTNYIPLKNRVIRAAFDAGFSITDHLFVEREDDTGYYHYAVDTAKEYEFESEE